jgi:hypothetical protein
MGHLIAKHTRFAAVRASFLKRNSFVLGVFAFTICAIPILWWLPKEQVASLRGAKGVNAQDVFKAENEARATLAQIIGGVAILMGVCSAWQNYIATKEGQITERFTRAI